MAGIFDAMAEVNNNFYDEYGERWYTAYDDPVALLRAENKIKFPWILEKLKEHSFPGAAVLDVACGGGFLSNELARAGFAVTGVDISPESIQTARKHDVTGSVTYEVADALHLPYSDNSFDVVTAMDFLEHVEKAWLYINEFSRILKPGGMFFFHTFNRNFISWLVVIKFVEWFVKNTPPNMHVLKLFIKPSELVSYCRNAAIWVYEMKGTCPVPTSISLEMIRTGVVSKNIKFKLINSTLMSYIGHGKKL